MRLIDADKLRKDVLDLPNCYNGFSDTYDKAMVIDLVDEQPTVDPIKHGVWKSTMGWVYCSECGNEPPSESNIESDYCPYCGAKMDGVVVEKSDTYSADNSEEETNV